MFMKPKRSAAFASLLWLFALCWQSDVSVAANVESGPIVEIITEFTSAADAVSPEPAWVEISLNQHRATLYRGSSEIKKYPIAIGREGWETPLGDFHVFQMLRDPNWKHPLNGKIFRAGHPQNALGHYWIGFWTDGDSAIGFHGTPHRKSVGKASSHGCIRMYERDVEELFSQLRLGTPVTVVP